MTEREELAVLLDAVRAGRAEACRELYARFVRVVHGIALARVGRQEAEDVAQEVFARAFSALRDVREAAAFPAWICTLARNMAIDAARRAGRRPRTVSITPPLADSLPDGGTRSAASAFDGNDLRERVLAHIRSLPDAYRETLLMRLAEGLTGPEIAERTGLTPESVRVNLSRGMALLRPLLREEELP